MHPFSNINYMKYITLFLLLAVVLYGMETIYFSKKTTTASATSVDELPIYCVDTKKPLLALTFDSAWGDEDLEEILSILKKHNLKFGYFDFLKIGITIALPALVAVLGVLHFMF